MGLRLLILTKPAMRSFISQGKNRVLRRPQYGLSVAHQRCLLRIIFLSTTVVLPVIAIVQFLDGNLYFALAAVVIAAISLFSAYRIRRADTLAPWVIGYLVTVFCFVVFVAANSGVSSATYVWAFIIPILCYPLLGRAVGLAIAAPFMAYVGVCLFMQLTPLDSVQAWLALLNPIICGVVILLVIHLHESMRADERAGLAALATTDTLTDLANRNSFQTTLERTINESGRSNTRFALVLMDIDHFKQVNDTLGHDAGDRALQLVAHYLSERLRRTDAIDRIGGEELGLILRDVDAVEACELTEKLRARIAHRELVYGEHKMSVTATFGIGHWPQDTRVARDLYQIADRRLYAGKHAGRNVIVSNTNVARADPPAEVYVVKPQISVPTSVQADAD